ncbi:ubiquitin thioesterase OTU1-like [Centruroides vittatus]|uniref:ubiquitin thioesterase OTU1-like n=1 Tax=Centruroides vittatus TaxID=120091 RepID=UPI00350F15BA
MAKSFNKSRHGKTSSGILLRYSVPPDNSCLFTSVYFGVSNGKFDNSASYSLRVIIADAVAADPQTYNETYLDQSSENYCNWILKEDSWGGAIELSILSNYYGIEIVVVNIVSTSLHKFGEDKNYSERILLIYNGTHYDPLMFERFGDEDDIQTLFPTSNEEFLKMALEIARELKSIDFNSRDNHEELILKCFICKTLFENKSEAQRHYENSGHYAFCNIKQSED